REEDRVGVVRRGDVAGDAEAGQHEGAGLVEGRELDVPAVDHRVEVLAQLPGAGQVGVGQALGGRAGHVLQQVDPLLVVVGELDVLVEEQVLLDVLEGEGRGQPLDVDVARVAHDGRQPGRVDGQHAVDRLPAGLRVQLGRHVGERDEVGRIGRA